MPKIMQKAKFLEYCMRNIPILARWQKKFVFLKFAVLTIRMKSGLIISWNQAQNQANHMMDTIMSLSMNALIWARLLIMMRWLHGSEIIFNKRHPFLGCFLFNEINLLLSKTHVSKKFPKSYYMKNEWRFIYGLWNNDERKCKNSDN